MNKKIEGLVSMGLESLDIATKSEGKQVELQIKAAEATGVLAIAAAIGELVEAIKEL